MRALIIDDSLLLRKMVQKAVNTAIPAINQFEYAGDGIEAVQVLRSALRSQQKYDLIVTDTNMPKMSGLEFMERIQKEKLCPGTHIIMITTENSPEHVASGEGSGIEGEYLEAVYGGAGASGVESAVSGEVTVCGRLRSRSSERAHHGEAVIRTLEG